MSYLGPDTNLSDGPNPVAYRPNLEPHKTVGRYTPHTPIIVGCPRCGAAPGQKCLMRMGWVDGVEYFFIDVHVAPHTERRKVKVGQRGVFVPSPSWGWPE